MLSGKILEAVGALALEEGLQPDLSEIRLQIEIPPRAELGDISFPMFPFAKVLRMSPKIIAEKLLPHLVFRKIDAAAAGPYINIHYKRAAYTDRVIKTLLEMRGAPQGEHASAGETHSEKQPVYGSSSNYAGEKIIIEFSSPNTNKPLHLGHLRNNALGESLARILRANGAEVHTVNLINDRGIHICKSMLAYQEEGGGRSPEDAGMKPDHFVGTYYITFNEIARKDPEAEQRAQDMLRRWEAGDEETVKLWKTMNTWTMEGLLETYRRIGIRFDTLYYESDTYAVGRECVLRGLEQGLFYKDEKGTIRVDLSDIGLDDKVLLRSDGTSVYITQDIGTAIARHGDWPFDRMFYVVANEQNYHFQVLFHVLGMLGLAWAQNLRHVSYGMVNLPDGRMKSREGTVVDADDLLNTLHRLARAQIREKTPTAVPPTDPVLPTDPVPPSNPAPPTDPDPATLEPTTPDPEHIAESVALAAVNFYLLQVSPSKDMIFRQEDSISFTGNSGPYLQYVGARISSIFRKYRKHRSELPPPETINWGLLNADIEWELIKTIARFPDIVEQSGRKYDPSIITSALYELGKTFSRFYHDYPILNCPRPELRDARLYIAWAVREVLKEGFFLLNIPFLESM